MALTTEVSSTKNYYSAKGQKWAVFGAGAFAGATMTLLMVLLLVTGITHRSLANVVADRLAGVFPPQIQEFFIQAIGPLGKDLLFYGVLIGQVVAGGLLALLLTWLWPQIPNRASLWRNIFILTTSFWVLVVLAVLPLLNAGLLASDLGGDQIPFLLTSFLLFQAFGLALGYFFVKLVRPVKEAGSATGEDEDEEGAYQPSRRRFVIALSGFFVAALAVGLGAGAFKVKNSDYWSGLGELEGGGKLAGEVTPNDTFYNVSKNAFDPNVNAAEWQLDITGLVDKPLSFNYDTIRQLPTVNQGHTLTCISNPVGGNLIGNAEWKGTRLKDLLATAGVKPNAKTLVFYCADGYTDSIPLEKAMDPLTLLVWEMNGAPLPASHGYPVRALIPNIYGMKNAKWIKEIRMVDTGFEGFWQAQGWDNVATIKTESTITFPVTSGEVKNGERTEVRGFAFAGERGIQKVELSTDGGQTWQETQLKEGLGQNSWQLWRFDWTPDGSGKTVNLVVRATDKTGQLQTRDAADPYPDGSSGWHSISVRIV